MAKGKKKRTTAAPPRNDNKPRRPPKDSPPCTQSLRDLLKDVKVINSNGGSK